MTPTTPMHPPAPSADRSRRQLASVALAVALATSGVLPVFLTGALSVQIEVGLHVGTTAIGGAVATYFAASALSSVRAGRLAERVGPFKVMLVAVGLAAFALLGIGLMANSVYVLLAFLVAGGVSNGAMQPAVNLLLARAVDEHRQGLAFGIKQAAIPSATLLSGLAVPALALTAGWHAAYLAAAGLALVVGAALVFGGRRLMPAPAATGVPARAAGDAGLLGRGREAGGPGGTFDLRLLVFLAAAMACGVAAANSLGSFVVAGAVHDGVAPGLAGVLSAAGSVVGLSARVGFGWRADRTGLRGRRAANAHLETVAVLIAVGALGYGMLAFGNVVLLVPAVLIAYGGGWGYNGLFNLAVVRAYPENPGRATGVAQVGTYIGGMVGPITFGIVADHLGFNVGWGLCAGLAVLAVTAFSLSRRSLGANPVTDARRDGALLEASEEASEGPSPPSPTWTGA